VPAGEGGAAFATPEPIPKATAPSAPTITALDANFFIAIISISTSTLDLHNGTTQYADMPRVGGRSACRRQALTLCGRRKFPSVPAKRNPNAAKSVAAHRDPCRRYTESLGGRGGSRHAAKSRTRGGSRHAAKSRTRNVNSSRGADVDAVLDRGSVPPREISADRDRSMVGDVARQWACSRLSEGKP
jgi:hypothetical protein